MANEVVVSRIQNRRGTQAEFDALPNPKLQPGEIGLITDTDRVFIGNADGTLLELTVSSSAGINFTPIISTLVPTYSDVHIPPPSDSWTIIPVLDFAPTDFLNILYSATENTPDESIPPGFSKNGELTITSSAQLVATLNDAGTEINTYSTPTPELGLMVSFSGDNSTIQVKYTHNFPYSLTFKTGTIQWAPF